MQSFSSSGCPVAVKRSGVYAPALGIAGRTLPLALVRRILVAEATARGS